MRRLTVFLVVLAAMLGMAGRAGAATPLVGFTSAQATSPTLSPLFDAASSANQSTATLTSATVNSALTGAAEDAWYGYTFDPDTTGTLSFAFDVEPGETVVPTILWTPLDTTTGSVTFRMVRQWVYKGTTLGAGSTASINTRVLDAGEVDTATFGQLTAPNPTRGGPVYLLGTIARDSDNAADIATPYVTILGITLE